jgi:hypothetical protein
VGSISIWQILIISVVLLPLLFIPTIIALVRNHPYKIPIILINIFGAWLWGIGWVIALIWCFIWPSNVSNTSASRAEEIEKMYELKEKGILTDAEFELKKKELL